MRHAICFLAALLSLVIATAAIFGGIYELLAVVPGWASPFLLVGFGLMLAVEGAPALRRVVSFWARVGNAWERS